MRVSCMSQDIPAGRLRTAVLVPCYNEAETVATVVRDFRKALPDAVIYVYDNNSTDATAEIALKAGAVVRREKNKGKGNVVRRMFSDIDADIYVMVDGDATYNAAAAPALIEELLSGPHDMVNCARVADSSDAYRAGHVLGNKLLTGLVRFIFGTATTDMLSGYKAFSRRFVKSFPTMSRGFEIETELIVHALELRVPLSEIETVYKERPAGSESKLRTYHDGFRILRLIGFLVKEERPMTFFSIIALLLALLSVSVGASLVVEFLATGLVPRLPTAVLAVGLMLSALLSISCGFILDTVARGRRETKRMAYLAYPAVRRV
jgi:glycosyltransferase involved in cell wall biosynthesis